MPTCKEDARSLPLPPTTMLKPCSNPHCPRPTNVVTHRCGACRCARYCSKECQLAMWPEHKNECLLLKQAKEERKADMKAAGPVAMAAFAASSRVPIDGCVKRKLANVPRVPIC
mmetsp:Transcript_22220/g.46012  ORF Transcript_22220/g.46012 Transcript_22220/m.46012 type:complete len:114 (+) Transcript_22220:374-715(+)